ASLHSAASGLKRANQWPATKNGLCNAARVKGAPPLPALGLQVVDMDMSALGDVGDDAADVLAILDRRIADLEVGQRHLVPDRHVVDHFQREARIVLRHHTEHFGTGFQALDHYDADIVALIV